MSQCSVPAVLRPDGGYTEDGASPTACARNALGITMIRGRGRGRRGGQVFSSTTSSNGATTASGWRASLADWVPRNRGPREIEIEEPSTGSSSVLASHPLQRVEPGAVLLQSFMDSRSAVAPRFGARLGFVELADEAAADLVECRREVREYGVQSARSRHLGAGVGSGALDSRAAGSPALTGVAARVGSKCGYTAPNCCRIDRAALAVECRGAHAGRFEPFGAAAPLSVG